MVLMADIDIDIEKKNKSNRKKPKETENKMTRRYTSRLTLSDWSLKIFSFA